MQRKEYDQLRPVSYPALCVALMSFSTDPPDCLENYMNSERLKLRHFIRSVLCLVDKAAAEIVKARKTCQYDDQSSLLSHSAIDVILMCFSIDSSDSLDNYTVSDKRQVRRFFGSAPVYVKIRKCFSRRSAQAPR
ncbi:hypothetical protein HPB51_027551 [Rhipicephalus microplus]|uniref:Uncharacterized protein n=1 Tax=Rhipicephalus microplus TaxID=6941 RepID=A0A9J6D029_RHIMP|nr:hypothetical protein HPB51_027551 [Rhipicephalus microplus]